MVVGKGTESGGEGEEAVYKVNHAATSERSAKETEMQLELLQYVVEHGVQVMLSFAAETKESKQVQVPQLRVLLVLMQFLMDVVLPEYFVALFENVMW